MSDSLLSRYFDEKGPRKRFSWKKIYWRQIASKNGRKKLIAGAATIVLAVSSFFGIRSATADRLGTMYCLQTVGTAVTTTIIKNGSTCLVAVSASTTWRVPSGVTNIRFLMVGGGAGGSSDGGGGGGGGAGIEFTNWVVTPGSLANIVVGTGGNSSSNGGSTSIDFGNDSSIEFQVAGGTAGAGFTTRTGGSGGGITTTQSGATTNSGGNGGMGPSGTSSATDASNSGLQDGFTSNITGTSYYYGGGGGGGIAAQANGNNNATFGRARGGFGGGGAGAIQLSTGDTADNRDVSWIYRLDGSNLYEQVDLTANCSATDTLYAHATRGFPGLNGYGGGGGGGAAYGDGCAGSPSNDDGERTDGGRGGDGVVLISYTYTAGTDSAFNSTCNQTVGTAAAISVALTNGNCVLTFSANTTWTIPTGVNLVRMLLVGGGAGGKNDGGGGGGGGGVINATSVTLTPGNVANIVVGTGGGSESAGNDTKISFDSGSTYPWIAGGGQLGNNYSSDRAGGNAGSTTYPSGASVTVSSTTTGHGGLGASQSSVSRRPASNASIGNGLQSDITGTNLYYGGGGGGGVAGTSTGNSRQTEINGGMGGFGGGGAGAMTRSRDAVVKIKYKVDGLFGSNYSSSLTAYCLGNTSLAGGMGMTKGFDGLSGFGGGGGAGGAYGDGCTGSPNTGNDGERTDGGSGGAGAIIISYPTVVVNAASTIGVFLDATYNLSNLDTSAIFDFSSKITRPASGWTNTDLIAAEVAITAGTGADDDPVFRGSGNCLVDLSNDGTNFGFGDTQANGSNTINGYSVFILNDRTPQLSVQGTFAAVVNALRAVKVQCDNTASLRGKYVRVGAVPTVSSSTCTGSAVSGAVTSGTLSCGELYYIFSTKHYYRIGTVSTARVLDNLFASANTMTIPVDGTNKSGATRYGWVATLTSRDEIILTNAIGSGIRMIGTTDEAQTWAWNSNWGNPAPTSCTTASGAFKWLGPDSWCQLVPTWNHRGTTTLGSSSQYWKLDSQTNLWGFGTSSDYTLDFSLATAPNPQNAAGAVHTNGYGVYHSWHRAANGTIDEPNDSGTFAYQGYAGPSGEPGWDDADDTGATQFYAEFCSGLSGYSCTPPDSAVSSTLLTFPTTTVRYATTLPVDPQASTFTATTFKITGGSDLVITCLDASDSNGTVTPGILKFDVGNTGVNDAADTQNLVLANGQTFTITINGDKTNDLAIYGLRVGVDPLINRVVISKVSGKFSSSQYVRFRAGPWYTGGPTNCDTLSDMDTSTVFQLAPLNLSQKRSATITIKHGGNR